MQRSAGTGLRRRRAARVRGEAGHPLTEVLVAMGVMSLAAALAVGGTTQAHHFATRYDCSPWPPPG